MVFSLHSTSAYVQGGVASAVDAAMGCCKSCRSNQFMSLVITLFSLPFHIGMHREAWQRVGELPPAAAKAGYLQVGLLGEAE